MTRNGLGVRYEEKFFFTFSGIHICKVQSFDYCIHIALQVIYKTNVFLNSYKLVEKLKKKLLFVDLTQFSITISTFRNGILMHNISPILSIADFKNEQIFLPGSFIMVLIIFSCRAEIRTRSCAQILASA